MSEATTPVSTNPAVRGYQMAQITGRGLWLGEYGSNGKRRVYSQADWEAQCKQAVSWGCQAIHPKVADGPGMWYTSEELGMLASVAHSYKLVCYPYHYCYGNAKGSSVGEEASLCADIGKIFGGVCPDIEVEWEQSANSPTWAKNFGQIVRASFSGPVLPTLFAACSEHPAFPYQELLAWVSGWMPMAYYDEWTSAGKHMTAAQAVTSLYQQWLTLSENLVKAGIFPPPILPIIELGQGLAASEVTSWLTQMQHYGYCGFWYDGTYAPYATTIAKAPLPSWVLPAPAPATTSSSTSTTTTSTTPAASAAPQVQVPSVTGMQQNLTLTELEVFWQIATSGQISPFNGSNALCAFWAVLLQNGYGIGGPLRDQEAITVSGKSYQVLECEGGRLLLDENVSPAHVGVQLVSAVRLPGSPTTA